MNSLAISITATGEAQELLNLHAALKKTVLSSGLPAEIAIQGTLDLDFNEEIDGTRADRPTTVAELLDDPHLPGDPPSLPQGTNERARKCLHRATIKTIDELLLCSEEDLLYITNFGKRSLELVESRLSGYGLELASESNSQSP